MWNPSSQDENVNGQNSQDLNGSRNQERHMSEMELKQLGSGPDNQHQQIETSQELNAIPLQQKQLQDNSQQQQVGQSTLHFSRALAIQNSEKNPVHIREPDRKHNPESDCQNPNLQKMNNQQAMAAEQGMNSMNRGKLVPFGLLLPVIQPQLDKDRAMQLQTLFLKLKKNEISKDGFVRHMRSIVGDQMLRMAIFKLHEQGAVPRPLQKGVTSPEDVSLMPSSAAQLKTHANLEKMDSNGQKSREMEHQFDLRGMPGRQMPSSNLSNINQEKEHSTIPIQGLSKQQQQHLHFSQSSYPIYGNTTGNYAPFSGANVGTSASSLKQQPHDSQMRPGPVHQSTVTERSHSFIQQKRVQGGSGTLSHLTNNSTFPQNSLHWQSSANKEQKGGAGSSISYVKQEPIDQGTEQQHKSQLSSPQGLSSLPPVQGEHGNAMTGISKDKAIEMQSSRMGFSTSASALPPNSMPSSMTPPLDPNILLNSRTPSAISPVNNAKTPLKKPSVGQKKPLETFNSSPPLPSKKQKVSAALLDQSIEQLNDVTAVSGVNLREEEEQLFSGPKEESRISEASRRVVQEEEERMILQTIPLQMKLGEIMSKCSVKSMSNDVERCLSLCVEERMRGLITNLIRLSKQRVDVEKARHQMFITSDVQRQIMEINSKTREEWDRKQAEAEKLQKLNEPEGNAGDAEKEKDEGRAKGLKSNKEEDDKMRATAANVAARAAVGGDDMLSKWQLMAEQARQKRGGSDAASSSQQVKDVSHRPPPTTEKNATDNQEAERGGQSTATMTSGWSRKSFTRNQDVVLQTKIARFISIKDVIAALEREPQMSRTSLIYRLYEKAGAGAGARAE
ncbi:transcription initiation factor TFIID subunit 4b-like isoform X2 [Diospyros lotus]|uniref:transcription initiation factor TFIID subunit 4b-like isoform X2 n=1 Tax=Diospyros lotus TaxID=55363 RepID=UPI002257DBFE|nr:transcription initiation factor TFIID subunit 4b-like isoform X2 [Diospyros lotus]